MASRLELQSKLEELLGSENVYYQPPANVQMSYPAIKYSKKNINTKYADNKSYNNFQSYEIIVLDYSPDNPVIQKLLGLPYCSYDTNYKADNLEHDVLTLYF